MRLDQLLVEKKLCESRTEAQELIQLGAILVNGVAVSKQTKQCTGYEAILVTQRRRFVSRGGEKLLGVLTGVHKNEEGVRIALQNKHCLDIGSSTGGFTDCLLQYGVSTVDAVDVGTGQLHESLRSNPCVKSYEQTDIRDFAASFARCSHYDIVVADLSFMSLAAVLRLIVSFGRGGTEFYLLIKPQFEVGKGNTKKGIVKDVLLVNGVLSEYENQARALGLKDVRVSPCVIQGGDGNQEYFLSGVL